MTVVKNQHSAGEILVLVFDDAEKLNMKYALSVVSKILSLSVVSKTQDRCWSAVDAMHLLLTPFIRL